jgi:hypothetical protein
MGIPELPRFPAEPGRDRLGFRAAVLSSFHFLITDFDFAMTQEESTLVRFESEGVVVNVFHGRSSYELGVEFGLRVEKSKREFRYSLRTVIALLDTTNTSGYKDLQTSSAEKLPALVIKLADWTRKFAPDLLRGEPKVWERLRYQGWLEGRRTTELYNASSFRIRAKKAWDEGDYGQVVNAYIGVKALETAGDLTPSEVMRLRQARWKFDDARAKEKEKRENS